MKNMKMWRKSMELRKCGLCGESLITAFFIFIILK